jgi:hypothetical protein
MKGDITHMRAVILLDYRSFVSISTAPVTDTLGGKCLFIVTSYLRARGCMVPRLEEL